MSTTYTTTTTNQTTFKKEFLAPKFDARKSFYKKAEIVFVDNKITLLSYGTKVAEIIGNDINIYGTYSQTTLRHLKEFIKQFSKETKADIKTIKEIIESTK